jgi:hypothetical protein
MSMSNNIRRLPERATPTCAENGRTVANINGAASGTRFTATTFSVLCDKVLGTDAGGRLHEATGYPERSCYYYASGERVAPVHFILTLFADEFYGPQFFDALMETNDSNWWAKRERHRRMGETIDKVR